MELTENILQKQREWDSISWKQRRCSAIVIGPYALPRDKENKEREKLTQVVRGDKNVRLKGKIQFSICKIEGKIYINNDTLSLRQRCKTSRGL